MKLKLFLSVLFFCAITKAQTNTELKDFINKNNVAIRTVQKNMLRENNSNYIITFKELVKNQEAAVKLYNTNKETSYHFSLLVRKECLDFLKTHTKSSTEYFEISDTQKTFLKASSENNKNILTSIELKTIENLDAMNPQSLNTLTLIIQ